MSLNIQGEWGQGVFLPAVCHFSLAMAKRVPLQGENEPQVRAYLYWEQWLHNGDDRYTTQEGPGHRDNQQKTLKKYKIFSDCIKEQRMSCSY